MRETNPPETLTKRVAELEQFVALQQKAIEMLGEAVRGHQRIIEAQSLVQSALTEPTKTVN